jgi:hypothetical protein
LTLNFVISSLIVGTFKSVSKTVLDIYHGAFTLARRTLFWYLCNISITSCTPEGYLRKSVYTLANSNGY